MGFSTERVALVQGVENGVCRSLQEFLFDQEGEREKLVGLTQAFGLMHIGPVQYNCEGPKVSRLVWHSNKRVSSRVNFPKPQEADSVKTWREGSTESRANTSKANNTKRQLGSFGRP